MQSSAPAPPPLLQCVTSFAVTPKLTPLLAQHPALLEATIAVLAAPHASSASRDASLAILESLLDQEQPLQEAALRPHTRHLLQSLQCLVTAAAGAGRSQMPSALKAKAKVPSAAVTIPLESTRNCHAIPSNLSFFSVLCHLHSLPCELSHRGHDIVKECT